MFDYLQQFNKLPKELRDRVSSPAAMEILSSLESKYSLSLAMLVMQVMVKQILIKDLASYLIAEMGLTPDKAQSLSKELQERLFFSVASYLGLHVPPPMNPEEAELQVLMKENGVVLPSQDLMARCRQILFTYRKGIRTKIDTRSALERPVMQGGLGLDAPAADRLLKALDRPSVKTAAPLPQASSALADLINKNEAAAYDLKSAIASGTIKAPESLASKFKPLAPKLDLQHELEAPETELALEAPDKVEALSAPKSPIETIAKISTPETKAVPAPHDLPLVETTTPLKTEIDKINEPVLPVTPKIEEKIVPPISTPAIPVKTQPLSQDEAAIMPETKTTSVKFAPTPKSHLWSKLFKSHDLKKEDSRLGKITASSDHLAEAVKAASQAASTMARPAASTETKMRMDDVKARPKVMGPLEELRYLDLVNFRRLGNTPKEITDKLVMKIKLLEKDGYDRMVEGVRSWRQSPVNRIYVRLAQEAVAQGITLRDAVAARQAAKKETLSMEEIEAIVAMNSRLMF